MYECESWNIKKSWAPFELWCWRRLLRVPWTARRSIQSILKEISPEYALEGLMLKLKCKYLATWYEELTHLKRSWCWERLKTGGERDNRGWNGWMASLTWWTWVWVNSGSWDGQGSLVCCSPWGRRVGCDWTEPIDKKLRPKDIESSPSSHCYLVVKLVFKWWLFFSCLVVSDSLKSYGQEHARLPCPSLSSRAFSNSCPLSQWCHPIISCSVLSSSSPPAFSLAQNLSGSAGKNSLSWKDW